jgi:actin-related protein 2
MSDPVIIFDNGSGYLKAGLSTSQIPKVTIPALVGRPMLRYAEQLNEVELKPIMIGDEIIPVRSLLELSYPITEGIIENDEDMYLLWNYCTTKKLGFSEEEMKEKTILITEAPSNPLKNKQKMMEILFEKMGVKRMMIEPQAKLTLICEGLTTGIVLDSGDGVSHCIPVFDNSILEHNIKRLNLAGRHITNYLTRLLQLK